MAPTATPRRSTRRKKAQDDEIPEVFKEMVKEDKKRGKAEGKKKEEGEGGGEVERPLKRRKTAAQRKKEEGGEQALMASGSAKGKAKDVKQLPPPSRTPGKGKGKEKSAPQLPTPVSASKVAEMGEGGMSDIKEKKQPERVIEEEEEEEEDSDDDSDIDWEEVNLAAGPSITAADLAESKANNGPLELVLNDPATLKSARGPKKKTITSLDRLIRLETHKVHIMCLLTHLRIRSQWCNDSTVHDNLLTVLPDEAYTQLNHDPNDQQYRRTKLFMEGLDGAMKAFLKKFKVDKQGIISARWREEEELEKWSAAALAEGPMKKANFVKASEKMSGSRDTGAQLFCAMLRAARVTARIVCSLQVLPFGFDSDKKLKARGEPMTLAEVEAARASTSTSTEVKNPPSSTSTASTPAKKPRPKKPAPNSSKPKIIESRHPIFWTEAWCPPSQTWIPIDLFSTSTIAKPTHFEPPASDLYNTFTYILGIDPTHHITDITRRYAHSFTAKTRKLRLDLSVPSGDLWYRRILRSFSRPDDDTDDLTLLRDQLEEAELAEQAVKEPMPKNIADFKNHPVFALKRHLKKIEVIYPERKVGTVTVGSGAKKQLEPVYRRQDVKTVKTVDQWYMIGRIVKDDQQGKPLKFTPPRKPPANRRKRGRRDEDTGMRLDASEEEEGGGEKPDLPMYAEFQTQLYTPDPITNGLVPKNQFGNIDLYVSTMLPPGGIHIPHKLAEKACRILNIDYAAACTGFEFKARGAVKPVMTGVVVGEEFKEAVEEVVGGLEEEMRRREEEMREQGALERWRRWVLRLRIRERLGLEGEEAGGALDRALGLGKHASSSEFSKAKTPAKVTTKGRKKNQEEETPPPMDGDEPDFDELQAVAEAKAGGFITSPRLRTRRNTRKSDDTPAYIGGGGFLLEDEEEDMDPDEAALDPDDDDEDEAEYLPESETRRRRHPGRHHVEEEEEEEEELEGDEEGEYSGGGFIQDGEGDDVPVGGGFILDDEDGEGSGDYLPESSTRRRRRPGKLTEEEHDDVEIYHGGGGFLVEEEHGEGVFSRDDTEQDDGVGGDYLPDASRRRRRPGRTVEHELSDEKEVEGVYEHAAGGGGGGFIRDDDAPEDVISDGGGGFLPNDYGGGHQTEASGGSGDFLPNADDSVPGEHDGHVEPPAKHEESAAPPELFSSTLLHRLASRPTPEPAPSPPSSSPPLQRLVEDLQPTPPPKKQKKKGYMTGFEYMARQAELERKREEEEGMGEGIGNGAGGGKVVEDEEKKYVLDEEQMQINVMEALLAQLPAVPSEGGEEKVEMRKKECWEVGDGKGINGEGEKGKDVELGGEELEEVDEVGEDEEMIDEDPEFDNSETDWL